MLERKDFEALIPHAGRMCLLDRVCAWDGHTIHAQSRSHAAADHPLRRDGRLHAVHLAEYGAQATAIHGALRARAGDGTLARPGQLVALRELALACEFVPDDGVLEVHAHCLLADTAGSQYRFCVRHAGRVLMSGRCAVIHTLEGSLP